MGPLGRAVILLAVPMVLEMVMESVFAICDVFFVSRLGAGAVATVGLTESLADAGLLVGHRAWGWEPPPWSPGGLARRGPRRQQSWRGQAVLAALIASLILGIAGVLTGPTAIRLVGASDEVLAIGSGYARVLLGGSGTVVFLFVINAVFRGAGDAAIAMRVYCGWRT